MLTKILATIGPASVEPRMVARLIEDGVRAFRINFSHGQFADFEAALRVVRDTSEAMNVCVGVLGDLCGPKIRVHSLPAEGIELKPGDQVGLVGAGEFRLQLDDLAVVMPVTYADLGRDVQPGQRLFIDDGAVRLLVVDRRQTNAGLTLICSVLVGGLVTSGKGVNLPDTELKAPSVTERDWACVDWAVAHQIDFLALSFVRSADDVAQLRTGLQQRGASIPIVAKLEKPEAIQHLEAIVKESDGLMVARGDLGVEMDLAQVPVIQKRIIATAHDYGKPVIVATQMLQSMIQQASPTRAEVSDVANAMFEGADAVMLSGETAIGKYPAQAVRMMVRIAEAVEPEMAGSRANAPRPPRVLQESRYRTAALAHGVGVVAEDLGAKLVVTWSQRGGTARYLSQNRLPMPIVAFSDDLAALRRMSLLYAVTSIRMSRPTSVGAFMRAMEFHLIERRLASPGDPLLVVAGEPLGRPGVTNSIRIHYLSDLATVV